MPGIRIHHATASSVVYTLVDAKRPYQAPVDCWRCDRTHALKTYHIDLDPTGHAIVSPEIWERLQGIPDQPFALVNSVRKPPTQHLAVGKPIRLDELKPLAAHEDS